MRYHSALTSVTMANRKVLLCLLFVYFLVNIGECRRGGSSGRSSGRSSSSSRGSSSSHYSSSSYSKHSYPSSSSGLSGFGSYSKPSYPSSSSGLSGFGSYSKPSYPSSSSGLSGSGSYSKPSYPSSSSGLSGSGSYSKPSYPSSSSGSSYTPPRNTHYYSSNSYNTNSGYTPHNVGYGTHVVHNTIPSYYTSPQYVYVNEYRHSDSRYGDLLTGLALYNMGRSSGHYHEHYYYDDYYRRRYNSPTSEYKSNSRPDDEALCTLKITENNKVETLKIPCEIVSTFTEESSKVSQTVSQVNTTVCTTKTVLINNTVPNNETLLNTSNVPSLVNTTLPPNVTSTSMEDLRVLPQKIGTILSNGTIENASTTTPKEGLSLNSTLSTHTTIDGSDRLNGTAVKSKVSSNMTMVNITVCNTTVTNATDPLSLKGPPVNTSNMQCFVEIKTKQTYFSNKVSCDTLINYAKMPEPARDTGILPAKNKLKKWLSNPPWWLSMFIAV